MSAPPTAMMLLVMPLIVVLVVMTVVVLVVSMAMPVIVVVSRTIIVHIHVGAIDVYRIALSIYDVAVMPVSVGCNDGAHRRAQRTPDHGAVAPTHIRTHKGA